MNLPWVKRSALDEAQGQLQALNQEFQNYRRRTVAAEQTARENGKVDAVITMLSVYDNLQRALMQTCDDEAYVIGIRMTMKSLTDAFEALGSQEITAIGETFDPQFHEALEHISDSNVGENTITAAALTGFKHQQRVIRPALVTVAN